MISRTNSCETAVQIENENENGNGNGSKEVSNWFIGLCILFPEMFLYKSFEHDYIIFIISCHPRASSC
jgi:hypothetical protein